MKNLLYLNSNISDFEYRLMGISLNDVWDVMKNRVNNILLIKSDFLGNDFKKNFEIISGRKSIEDIIKEYSYGELAFIDFKEYELIEMLEDEEIAEILFIGHMHRPIRTPFVSKLQNDYVYISHDNGFFCKLYCRFKEDFAEIIKNKIEIFIRDRFKENIIVGDKKINEYIIKASQSGILIDLDEIKLQYGEAHIPIYNIGVMTNMDEIINQKELIKGQAKKGCLSMHIERYPRYGA